MKTEHVILKNVHTEYAGIYKNILSHIWPSLGSTGFAERNLSVNFTRAYEVESKELEQDVIVWFEFQIFGDDGVKDNHIDAIMINYSTKEIFMIESKRFSNVPKKKTEILKDISRLSKEDVNKIFAERIDDIRDYEVYACILTDIWDESKEKKRLFEVFSKYDCKCIKGEIFFDIIFGDEYKKNNDYPGVKKCLDKEIQVFCNSVSTKYSLASFVWRISEPQQAQSI